MEKGLYDYVVKGYKLWPMGEAPMILPSWFYYGALLLLSLLTLRGLYSLGLRIAKHRSMSAGSLARLEEKERTMGRTTKAAVLWILFFSSGWLTHDLWQFHHTYVLADVEVIDNTNMADGHYIMASGGQPQTFTAKFCPDYVPQFPIGVRLKVLVYEDRGWCWSISNRKLGYIIQR